MLGRKYDSVSIPYDIDQEHGILRKIDSVQVRLSSLAIEVNEPGQTDDIAPALPLYSSTDGTASRWLETPTLGREEDLVEQNYEPGMISDHGIERGGSSSEELANTPRTVDNAESLRATMDRPLLSKRNGLSRAIPPPQAQPPTESASVEGALLDAIDNGLLGLGEVVRDTIYDRFDRKYQLKREEIPEKLDIFHKALQGMLGAGATVIETQIAKIFDKKLNLEFTENINWTIVDYFDSAKRTNERTSE